MVKEKEEIKIIKCPHCGKDTKVKFIKSNKTGNCWRCDTCKEGFYYDFRKRLLI